MISRLALRSPGDPDERCGDRRQVDGEGLPLRAPRFRPIWRGSHDSLMPTHSGRDPRPCPRGSSRSSSCPRRADRPWSPSPRTSTATWRRTRRTSGTTGRSCGAAAGRSSRASSSPPSPASSGCSRSSRSTRPRRRCGSRRSEPRIIKFEEVVKEADAQQDYYQTQYRILQCRSLANRVIGLLQLDQHPEFQRDDGGAGFWQRVEAATRERLVQWIAMPPPRAPESAEEAAAGLAA